MGERICFYLAAFYISKSAVVVLRYRPRSDIQSLSLHTTTRLSRKGIHPAGVPSFLFQVAVVQFGINEPSLLQPEITPILSLLSMSSSFVRPVPFLPLRSLPYCPQTCSPSSVGVLLPLVVPWERRARISKPLPQAVIKALTCAITVQGTRKAFTW